MAPSSKKNPQSRRAAPKHEQRRHERIESRLELPYWKYVKFKKNEEIHIGFVKNISRGGAFVETEVVFPVQTEIGFEFYVSTSDQPITGVATVVWSRAARVSYTDPDGAAGMGLQFKEFEESSAEILEAFFDKELKKNS